MTQLYEAPPELHAAAKSLVEHSNGEMPYEDAIIVAEVCALVLVPISLREMANVLALATKPTAHKEFNKGIDTCVDTMLLFADSMESV